ncbi:MAG: hypothetical protein HC922_03790 [Leptolyngbyaceae cyanobacterium SM2_3_12]|nr:hypothetical protein [Leptolyngbyaceae cyanobacterium SM2_3_12]
MLDQVNLPELIHQVLRLAPQRADLSYRLGRIVKRLNHQREYTRLANQLLAAMQPLYIDPGEGSVRTSLAEPSEDCPGLPLVESTRVVPAEPAAKTSSPDDLTTVHSALSALGPLAPVPEQVETEGPSPKDRSSLFDLRADIIQYANPLRAKVLLYSCLYGPFGYTAQDWSALSQYPLDQLLHQVLAYCPTHADLESKLTIIGHCLTPADDNAQVANAIIQAMKAYYPSPAATDLAPPTQGFRPKPWCSARVDPA